MAATSMVPSHVESCIRACIGLGGQPGAPSSVRVADMVSVFGLEHVVAVCDTMTLAHYGNPNESCPAAHVLRELGLSLYKHERITTSGRRTMMVDWVRDDGSVAETLPLGKKPSSQSEPSTSDDMRLVLTVTVTASDEAVAEGFEGFTRFASAGIEQLELRETLAHIIRAIDDGVVDVMITIE